LICTEAAYHNQVRIFLAGLLQKCLCRIAFLNDYDFCGGLYVVACKVLLQQVDGRFPCPLSWLVTIATMLKSVAA